MSEIADWAARQGVPIVVNDNVPDDRLLFFGDWEACAAQTWEPPPAPPFPGRVEIIKLREG